MLRLIGFMLLLALPSFSSADERVLFDFEDDFAFGKVEARSVKVTQFRSVDGSALRMATRHDQAWPGITLRPTKGTWDLSAYEYVALGVRNVGDNDVNVNCRVDNKGADGKRNCCTGNTVLKAGASGELRVLFKRKTTIGSKVKLFGMRGYPVETSGGEPSIDPSRVTGLLVFIGNPKENHLFEIDNVRAGGAYTPPKDATLFADPDRFFPMVDELGQYIHRDWPGKANSIDDLAKRRKAEERELAAKPQPNNWSEYGGWADGPTLKATGFFYPAKHDGKWWLVDPEGKLFFSHGVDCVGVGDSTPITDRGHWYRDLPPREGSFAECYSESSRCIRDYYKGKRMTCFDFSKANVIRKYGDNWNEKFGAITHRRLRSWGVNTIANWSSAEIRAMRRTPYVVALHFGGPAIEGSTGYWGQFPDVFDPGFKASLVARMKQEIGKSVDDPWNIGYFVGNELSWGKELTLAEATLASPADQVAKRVFVAELKAKYELIDALNKAWATKHASWEALLACVDPPNREKAKDDLAAFYAQLADQYFKVCREGVKEVAPSNLYLGCRFAWANATAVEASTRHCDVVSYNIYRRPQSIDGWKLPVEADVPVIIGEFHFGALDRGMFHTGLVPVADQESRAQAYRDYVKAAMRHPQFVGCHWFKYRDESVTGRPLDNENYQIGFIDVTDTPYAETIDAVREVGYAMYDIRRGK